MKLAQTDIYYQVVNKDTGETSVPFVFKVSAQNYIDRQIDANKDKFEINEVIL